MRDWFRHTDWSAEAEADFEARLRRARDKAQPLKIQAAALAETHPAVAIGLLDRYFATGDTLFLAEAYRTQSTARLALGDITSAAASFEAALDREDEFPNLKTNSFVEYPLLVAEHGLTERYARAIRVLEERKADVAFPLQRFMWHAARALILAVAGNAKEASIDARLALTAAAETSSGFRYHQALGLVGRSHSVLRERLGEIAAAAATD